MTKEYIPFPRNIIEKKFLNAKIEKAQIAEILPILEKFVQSGITQKDLDIVVEEIAINTTFLDKFLADPEGAANSITSVEFKAC